MVFGGDIDIGNKGLLVEDLWTGLLEDMTDCVNVVVKEPTVLMGVIVFLFEMNVT